MSKSSFCINPKSKQITELSNKLGVDPIFLALKADVWSYTTKLPITEDNWEEVKSFILDKLNIGKILDTDNKEYFDNLNTLYDTFNNKTIDSYSEAVVVLGKLQKAFGADNVVLLKTNNNKYKFSMSTPSLNGYTKEMFDIKKRAVADGTFMKAPNGNPTNLNERQWLQVRTKAFKEWFGDWEILAKIKYIQNNCYNVLKRYIKHTVPLEKVLRYIDSGIINKEEWFEYLDNKNSALSLILDFIRRLPVNTEGINVHYLNTNIRKELPYYKNFSAFVTNDSYDIYIIDDEDQYYENSEKIRNEIQYFIHEFVHHITLKALEDESFRNEVTNIYNAVIDNLKIKGIWDKYKDSYGFTNIEEFIAESISNLPFANILRTTPSIHKNTTSVYKDFVNALKELLAKLFGSPTSNKTALDDVYNLFYNTGDYIERPTLVTDSFKKNVSKVVDENGEPLVVYHGTNIDNIEVFDKNKGKEHGTFTATNRLGSFFTDVKSEAESYANITWLQNKKQGKPTIYNGFINIKNPLYFDTIHSLRTYMMSDFEYNEEGDPISKVIIDDKYDGIIVKQVNQSNLAKEIIIRNSNQIKSATDNIGTFSNDNNNVYLANNDFKSPYQEEAYRILKEIWNLGRELSPYEIESVNNRLRRLSDMAGDVPWFLRRSNAGNWYIAGYKNAPVTMAGYYSKTYNFRSNAISSEQFESMKDTTLRKEIFNGKDSITVTEALDAIEKRTPVLKPFIDMLRTSEYAKDVQIVLTKEGREFEYKNGKKVKAPGYYNPADNKIYIWENSAFMQVADEHKADTVILHEILHSITTDALFVNPEFKNRITSLMDSVKKYYKDNFDNADEIISNIYGLTNEYEFLSEAFSNSTFINTLLSIPVNKKKSKLETVFDSFINAIKNLFHISNDSLYNDVVTLLQDIMKYGNERFEAQSYYDEYSKNTDNDDFSDYDYENDLFLPAESINIYADTNENADLSNFAERPFDTEFDSVFDWASGKFNNVEAAFQAAKLNFATQLPLSQQIEQAERIIAQLKTATGAQARSLGRSIKGLNTQAWDMSSSMIMKSLLKSSFKQNPKALQRLLDTGNATLTHTQDRGKWGTEFPRLLMEVRSELAQERGITLNQQNNQQSLTTQYIQLSDDEKTAVSDIVNPDIVNDEVKRRKPMSEYDRQYYDLYHSDKIGVEEIKYMANYAMRMFSTVVSILKNNPDMNEEYFGDMFKDMDFTKMERMDIINTIGIEKLLNVVKEWWFNVYGIDGTESQLGDISPYFDADAFNDEMLEKYKVMYNNWKAFVDAGYQTLLQTEHIALTKVRKDDIKLDGVDESVDNEINGSAAELGTTESWQMGHQQVSSTASLSQDVRIQLGLLFMYDKNGNYVPDKYGFKTATYVNVDKAVSQLLYWTEGCETLDDMIKVLKDQAVLNPWLRGLIDENNGLLYKDKSFANKFFTNFRKQKVWYSATYKDGDKLKVKILNEKAIISDIINEVKLAYASDNISIVEGSKDKFKANKGNIENIKAELLEIRKQLSGINTASNQERTDIINDIIDKLVGLNSGDPGLLDNFGINKNLITNEILNNWRSHDYIAKSNITIDKIIREMSTICDTFSKQGKDEFNPFDVNSVANVYNSYKGIASALSTHIYEAVESSVYENSKMYYAYNNPSYLGTLITRLQDKARSNRTYEDFLKEEYLKYGFFCRNYDEKKSIKEIKDEDILCPMLRTLVKNDSARNVLKHMQMLNFDKIDYTEQDDLSYLKSLLAAFRFKNGMSNTGYYRIATLSDKPSSEFVRWYISSQDEIVTQMRNGIFLQEINRIKMLLDRATQKNIEKIKNYDIDEKTIKKNKKLFNRVFDALSKRDEKTGVTNITVDDFAEILKKVKGSGVRFTYLEHLNELNKNKKEDAVILQGIVNLVNNKDMSASQVSDFYEALDKKNNEFLDNLYTDEISEFEKLGLFETEEVKDDKGNVINIKFIHLGDYQEKSDFEKANKSIKVQQAKPKDRVGEIKNIMMNNMKARLKSFIINDCFVQMNLIELTSTDPAFFKNSNDFQKRNAQQHAPSIRMNISAIFKNKKGADVKYSADGKSRAMYLKDYEIISELIEGVNAAINLKKNNPNTSEAEKVALDTIRSQIVNALEKVNVADAQGYSCPTSYRKKMGMLGQWNEDTDEVAYQRILSGNFNTDDLNVLWQPLKPFVYSQHSMSASSIFSKFMKVPVQHKNSEYVIFLADAIIRGNKDGKTNKLTALFDFMENSAYDGRIIYRNGKFYKDGNIVKADSVEEKEVISLLKSKGIRKPEEIYDGYVVKEGTYNGAGIDTIMFESACKVGLHGKLDINEKDSYDEILSTLNKAYSVDENGNRITNDEKGNRIYNENFVDTFDFKDYGIQQAVPQHFIDHEQLYGSQIRILGFSDIRKDAVFSGNRSGSEIQKRAQDLVAANINASLKELEYDLMLNTDLLKEKLTNIIEKAKKSKDTDPIEYLKKSLDSLYKNNKLTAKKANDIANAFDTNKSAKEILDSVDLTISEREKNEAISKELESAIKRDVKYGPDLLRACKINSETGRFEIPLSDPTQSIRTQQLLCSIIKSRISKQKIAGGPVVQLSAWGTIVGSDSLKVLHDENGRIVGGECYIPYPSEDVRKAMMKYDESGKFIGMMSIEEAKKANIIDEDMLKSIGYRIPTEDKYSMMPLKVVGFVPSTAGEVVVLPQEITALSGSDFDIDKLYIMMKSYTKYTKFNSDKFKKVFNSKTTKTISARDNVNTFLSNVKNMGLEKAKELLGDNEFDNLIRDIVDNNSNEISDVKFRISNDNVDKNNNELIDLQYEVLTHQDTAIKFYNVGNFDEQKKVGKIITIAQSLPGVYSKNELEKKSIDELDEILDTVIPQKSIFRSSTQVYWHKQNMTAKALIGIFANNNTSHAFLNMQNIEYNFGDKGIVFNGNLFTRGKFDETLAFDGTYISKRIASFLAASVDAVKDPVLNFMNVNKSTANVAMLLARLGLSTSTIGMFLSQPIIRELVDTYEKKSSMGYVSLNNVIDEFRENKFKNKSLSLETYLNSDEFTDKKLFKNLNLPEPDMEYQQLCLEMFSYLLEPSKDMGEMTFMTKFNSITNAAGPTIADTLSMERRINQFLSKNDGIGSIWFEGTKGILDKDNSPLLNAFYTGTMTASRKIFTNLFPHYTAAFNTLLSEYENESNTYVTADTINDLVNFYTLAAGTALLKNNKPVFDFTEERRKELISDGFMSNIVRGSFKNNKFISSISITKEEKCPVRTMVIRMGNYTADMKEQAKSSWGALMDSTEGKKIGLDVFYYNLMRSGFEFSPKTGLPLASVDVKQAVDGYTELLERVNSEGLDSIDSLTFIEQYKRNYYYKSGVVTTLKENKLAKVEGDALYIQSKDENKPSSIIIGESEYGPRVMHIIRYNNELYKHIETTNDITGFTIKYKKVNTLGVKNNFIEVDMNDPNIKTIFNIKQNASSDSIKIGNALYEYISKQQPLLSQVLQSTSYNADVQKRINELQSTILDYRRMLTDLPLSKSEIIDTENKIKELQAELEKIKETQNICR